MKSLQCFPQWPYFTSLSLTHSVSTSSYPNHLHFFILAILAGIRWCLVLLICLFHVSTDCEYIFWKIISINFSQDLLVLLSYFSLSLIWFYSPGINCLSDTQSTHSLLCRLFMFPSLCSFSLDSTLLSISLWIHGSIIYPSVLRPFCQLSLVVPHHDFISYIDSF